MTDTSEVVEKEGTEQVVPTEKGSYMDKANSFLTIVIKSLVVVVLLTSLTVGTSFYSTYSHDGPSCEGQIDSFQHWLRVDNVGKVVSINQSKIQMKNGSTNCFGRFRTDSGDYKDWTGTVSELLDGSIVGRASLQD